MIPLLLQFLNLRLEVRHSVRCFPLRYFVLESWVVATVQSGFR